MKYSIFFCVLTFWTVDLAQSKDATCDKCVIRDQCEMFRNMNPTQQYVWMNKYPCRDISYNGFRVPVANGIYVCCSDTLWAAETGFGYGGAADNPILDFLNIFYDDDMSLEIPKEYHNYYPPPPIDVRNSGYPNVNVNPGGINTLVTPQSDFNYNTLPPRDSTSREQCVISSYPPKPDTGCCGLEASESDRINGGQETNLYQFPWAVYLLSIFDVGGVQKSFGCGGSLISARYVLTAAHCVYQDSSSRLIKVDAYLAEYDRTTFPTDCKNVMNYGKQCIDNIRIDAEEIIRHSQYEDQMLYNDIALIRLRENAPYTAFIRPVCLTPIDVDNTNFANLPLAVTGWGLNGNSTSNIKQSTVVNFVPHGQCKEHYPTMIRGQICAVGHSGQDTCPGDSGGPLMMLDGGKYYVVGIVSGKRSDTTCGTSVPTTYTSVYQYLDWILDNIRN